MLEKLLFYTRHSFNDLRVNGQRTIFALLCVAAGVAAIVSLQTLGVMIEDSLTGNLQESNKSDIRLSPTGYTRSDESIVAHSDTYDNVYITMNGIEELKKWFERRYPDQEVTITYRQFELGLMGTSVSIPAKETDKTFVASNIVEADKYPLYGEIKSESGTPLKELLSDGQSIVFSRNLADDLNAKVGDVVRLNGVSQEFTLRGIVPTNAEAGIENMMGALLGFYYLDTSALQYYTDAEAGAASVFIKLKDPSNVAEIDKALERSFNYLDTFSTADLEEQNSEISKYLNQLVIVMGLISLLIGGIG
ncbi:MAG TPA: ABC transporter permease, partial [Aggregatilineaceae bacterium]|nr:ABC transporter permease [Aggregatilineaceae bacterium]